jgi:hypothetical protein
VRSSRRGHDRRARRRPPSGERGANGHLATLCGWNSVHGPANDQRQFRTTLWPEIKFPWPIGGEAQQQHEPADDHNEFRIAAWPGIPLPLPSIVRQPYYFVADAAVFLTAHIRRPSDSREKTPSPIFADPPDPPLREAGEIYLRLLDVDLEQPLSILDFVNEYGILKVFDLDSRWQWPQLWLFRGGEEMQQLTDARRRAGPAIVEQELAWGQSTGPAHDVEPSGRPFPDSDQAAFEDETSETLTEFQFGARQIRDAVRALRFMRGELGLNEVEWESSMAHELAVRGDGRIWPRGMEDLLRCFFDDGLKAFHPSVSFSDMDDDEVGRYGGAVLGTGRGLLVAPAVTGTFEAGLYSICCLEIYNHLIEQTAYRRCQNERCGRLFVHQVGRAKFGQHRTRGVLYCSSSCARAQAQRELRRRRRAAAKA